MDSNLVEIGAKSGNKEEAVDKIGTLLLTKVLRPKMLILNRSLQQIVLRDSYW